MTAWIVVAPERDDDDALAQSAWIARQTMVASPSPVTLVGASAVRAAFENLVGKHGGLRGVAFFGHGVDDRLFDADRAPGADGPALLDVDNVALLRECWVHAYACRSGAALADMAVERGVAIYVGYCRPLDTKWPSPLPSPIEEALTALVTAVTLALLAGCRDERQLLAAADRAASVLVERLLALPDEHYPPFMWLNVLAQELVDHMVVRRAPEPQSR